MNLNKPGSGKKLLDQVKQHPGLTNKNSTRNQQLAVYKAQQKNPKKK